MKRTRLLAASAAAALTVAVSVAGSAEAAPTITYSFLASAGATQVDAAGLTVQSAATATSSVVGTGSQSSTNQLAATKAGTLLQAGAATTDATSTVSASGAVKLVSHARTGAISLLGGLIRAQAVVTTATVVADGTHTPTASMTTQLLGLKINGKSYPTDFDPNSGITIPGVVTIGFNTQGISASTDSASIIGAGLKITLLANRNGTSAGATVLLNPIVDLLGPLSPEQPGAPLGGSAFGSYADAHVGDAVEVKSGATSVIMMPNEGTDGTQQSRATARAALPGVLNVGAIQSSQTGVRSKALSRSVESSTVAGVNLFNGLIYARAIGTTSTASVTPSDASVDGQMDLLGLRVAGHAIPIDVAPNTTLHIANLGTVTLNEQTETVEPGYVHAIRTAGVHIVLDTARAGLPVGAEVYVATSEAIVWG